MRMYHLIVNSRPDSDGILWFMIDPSTGSKDYETPAYWAQSVAGYLAHNHHFTRDAIKLGPSNVYVGIDVKAIDGEGEDPMPLTCVVRRVSEYIAGNPYRAQFWKATHELSHEPTGPVLYFFVDADSKYADSER